MEPPCSSIAPPCSPLFPEKIMLPSEYRVLSKACMSECSVFVHCEHAVGDFEVSQSIYSNNIETLTGYFAGVWFWCHVIGKVCVFE